MNGIDHKRADSGCQSLFSLEAGKEETAEEYTDMNLNMSHQDVLSKGEDLHD
ncbi:hypothetical protein [Paenibacillus sp. JNUCC31]|uniref:hypothetical protein n=1 Tax=Paenibacillus sp. JNUCC-31 TaxID=2777983 RepID=UPI001E3310A5|nr:hypothetical protein [Paenibacillus sp. JNUCC-31]